MDTNVIEQRLLDREYARINAELVRGTKIITDVLKTLPRTTEKAEVEWVASMLKLTEAYTSEGWQYAVQPQRVQTFPDSMRKLLLDRLVTQFLDTFDELQDITNDLEQR